MGGQDKGLITWQGKAMVQHIIEALTPQADEMLISCNRNFSSYRKFPLPQIQDENTEYLGPLSGLLSAHKHCRNDLIAIVPCDCPIIPADLMRKLHENLLSADVSIAQDDSGIQPLFLLVRKAAIPSIQDYLASGKRSVRGWIETLNSRTTYFENRFLNLNQLQNKE